MVPADEFRLDDFRDVEEILVVKHAVNVLSALPTGLLVGTQLPGLLVFGLQFV